MKTELLQVLLEAARWAPSADNSQPWRLHVDGGIFDVRYDYPRVQGRTLPDSDPGTLLAVGALVENVLQVAERCEVTIDPLAPNDGAYFRFSTSCDGRIPPDIDLHPVFARQTNRLAYREDALPRETLDRLADQQVGDARALVFDRSAGLQGLAGLVRRSSQLRYQTQELHQWLFNSLRFTRQEAAGGDGLDLATLALPPGAGAILEWLRDWRRMRLLNRIGAYRAFAHADGQVFSNAAAIVAVVGGTGPAAALDAGRLTERLWLDLTREKLAVHPFYVVADQLYRRRRGLLPEGLAAAADLIADEAESLLRLQGRVLYMLLRVGYPRRLPVPRSRRLSLAQICDPPSDGAD
jgi:hypothetical protein